MYNYIRTSIHTTKYTNAQKKGEYQQFREEYRRVAQVYLDYLWENPTVWHDKNSIHYFNPKINTKLDRPTMLSNIWLNHETQLETHLTARALKCCLTQVLGIIGASVEKASKRQFVINKRRSKSKCIHPKLRENTRDNKPVKPNISKINLELNSICCNFQEEKDGEFDGFLQISSFTKTKKIIRIPIKYTKVSNKWKQKGTLKKSFLLCESGICMRWECNGEIKDHGITVGGDQGFKDVLTLSDKQVTPKKCLHGHSCESIIDTLDRRKKGGKGFRRGKIHLKNFVNWSVNRINFFGIRQLNQEEVRGLQGFGRMKHWSNPMIMGKIRSRCQEEEVLLNPQSCTYRSQRCSSCGLVLKSNRCGKEYICENCGLIIDADYNASLNHQQCIPDATASLRKLGLNRSGFFWKETGFFKPNGEEITVPHTIKKR
jgi:transposase